MTNVEYSPREELLTALLDQADEDTYPSATMLDIIESLLEPEERPAYAAMLMAKIRNDRFPSLSLIRRVQQLS
jgi:hypothetical protein